MKEKRDLEYNCNDYWFIAWWFKIHEISHFFTHFCYKIMFPLIKTYSFIFVCDIICIMAFRLAYIVYDHTDSCICIIESYNSANLWVLQIKYLNKLHSMTWIITNLVNNKHVFNLLSTEFYDEVNYAKHALNVLKIFYKFWSGRFKVFRQSWEHVSSLLMVINKFYNHNYPSLKGL